MKIFFYNINETIKNNIVLAYLYIVVITAIPLVHTLYNVGVFK